MTENAVHRTNLPKKNKMDKPYYQDYQAEQIQDVKEENLTVRVMAGIYKTTRTSSP